MINSFWKKNGGLILSIISSLGLGASVIFTAKGAIKANEALKEAEEKSETALTTKEKIKIVAPHYALPLSIVIGTTASIFGINALDRKYQASLVSSYALVSKAFRKYKDKALELIGEEKCNEIEEEIAKEANREIIVPDQVGITAECLSNQTSIDPDVAEETRLFYDVYSETYFESTLSKVIEAQYHLNRNLVLGYGFVPLSMWYEFLGLKEPDGSDSVGWMICDSYLWIDFINRETELEDGLKCIFIEFMFDPEAEETLNDFI